MECKIVRPDELYRDSRDPICYQSSVRNPHAHPELSIYGQAALPVENSRTGSYDINFVTVTTKSKLSYSAVKHI